MSEERARIIAVVAIALVTLAVGVAVGRTTKHQAPSTAAVRVVDGIPLGVQDTPAGALAAADNYVAIASQTVEQNPGVFARLVAQAYAPSARAATLAQAAAVRAADPTDVANYARGGRAVAVIGARRLDTYSSGRATVTTWLGGVVWGPGLPAPRQSWNLVDTTLAWQAGQWVVVSSAAESTPAPVPSLVIVNGPNNQTAAFDQRLAGMTAPFYGTGSG